VRRALPLALLVALICAGPGAGARPAPPSWAQSEIELVVSSGLMAADTASFRPNDPLTQAELADLVAGLGGVQRAAATRQSGPVTLAGLNAQLVRTLGLAEAASAFSRGARNAGLAPPARFGPEVVARLLGLRKNHLAAHDAIEPLPTDPVSRAEAAYSAARILRLRSSDLDGVRAAATSFTPPALDSFQRQILATAVGFVGYPYVWGGESERQESHSWPFGAQVQGGFDCSGFVWRVYKLQPYPEYPGLASVLRGRTTFELSAEAPRPARIPFAQLAPGDVVFFGTNGVRSKPAQIIHMGIYAGNGWMVHASDRGVTLVPLAGWYRSSFAWARRPLAEAGLTVTASR
jgi:cell wall-associated NlpC family hydrolase